MTNPLLAPNVLPFGAPPFNLIRPEHFSPALEVAFRNHREAVAAIANNPAPADFDNTLAALERSSFVLDRIVNLFHHYAATLSDATLQEIERELSPRLSRHQSDIFHMPGLFERIAAVHATCDTLPEEPRRLVEEQYRWFTRAGAALAPAQKEQLAELKSRLATGQTEFEQKLLKETEATFFLLDAADLDGLPPYLREAAAAEAARRGHPEKFAIGINRSSAKEFIRFSARRDLREKIYSRFAARGTGAYDTSAILREIVSLRQKIARLLGYPDYARFALEDSMAKTPEAARGLLQDIWTPALAKLRTEREELQAEAHACGQNDPLTPWDWDYYAEKVQQRKFALKADELAPYLMLDNILEAAFATAGKLFGLHFYPRTDLPLPHADTRIWEVRQTDGQTVGLFYGDYFARPGKRSGAWMSEFVAPHRMDGGICPVVANTCNFTRPAAGKPALLNWDEAHTVFHELGHALHALLSKATYPSLAGTRVVSDFVELPSQLLEHWLETPDLLEQYARHAETNAPMPPEMIARLHMARTFNQGQETMSFLASALVDLALYQQKYPETLDPQAFERSTLDAQGMPDCIAPNHRLSHFLHSMSDMYAAQYYCYLWAAVLDSDVYAAFRETGNFFDPKTAQRLQAEIYSSGNTRDPMVRFTAFRGRPPTRDALLEDRGLKD